MYVCYLTLGTSDVGDAIWESDRTGPRLGPARSLCDFGKRCKLWELQEAAEPIHGGDSFAPAGMDEEPAARGGVTSLGLYVMAVYVAHSSV